MSSFQNKVNSELLREYETRGFTFAVSACDLIINNKEIVSGYPNVNLLFGEICQTILEIHVKEYIKIHKVKDWFFSKSLILKEPKSYGQDYLTEIDFVLYTPSKIVIFECKSYKGDKVIEGKGEIKRSKGSFDVFSQHQKHVETFMKSFNPFINRPYDWTQAYVFPIFSYSSGNIEDKRDNVWKKIMPLMKSENLFPVFDVLRSGPVRWKTDYVKRAVKLIEANKERLAKEHLDYVRDLNRSRNPNNRFK